MTQRGFIRYRFWAAALATSLALPALAAGSLPRPTPAAAEYAVAEQAFRAGDLARAEQLYAKILHDHGDEPMAWFRVGLIQQRRQAFRAALSAYDSALACAPDESGEEMARVLAKVRYNRAVLLLESAERDLKSIPPGILAQDLDGTRQSLTTDLDAALLAARVPLTVDQPTTPQVAASGAQGYVRELGKSAAIRGTPREQHP